MILRKYDEEAYIKREKERSREEGIELMNVACYFFTKKSTKLF